MLWWGTGVVVASVAIGHLSVIVIVVFDLELEPFEWFEPCFRSFGQFGFGDFHF